MVLRRCKRILSNEEDALQAMQDTFVKLMVNEKKLTGTYPSSLLYRMATNVCLNIIRSRKHEKNVGDELLETIACGDNPETEVLHRNLLDKFFAREKETTPVIAVMFYVDGMTLDEVAKETGMSVSGVRKRLRNLKAKVKSLKEFA